jgi:hypothetical protein
MIPEILLDCSSVQTMWRLRICRFIDQHLDDPDRTGRIAGRPFPRYILAVRQPGQAVSIQPAAGSRIGR